MTQFKEQILADVKKACRNKKYWHERKHHAEFDFDLFLQDFEYTILAAMPSEKEIAKELHAEWLELPMDKLISFPDWLDKGQS